MAEIEALAPGGRQPAVIEAIKRTPSAHRRARAGRPRARPGRAGGQAAGRPRQRRVQEGRGLPDRGGRRHARRSGHAALAAAAQGPARAGALDAPRASSSSSTRLPARAARARSARAAELATRSLAAARLRHRRPVTGGPDDASGSRARRVASGARLVIAWGGDGTVNGAASARGRQRHSARDRAGRIGQRPGARSGDPARRRPRRSRSRRAVATRAIDAGEMHGSLFFNVAGHRLRRAHRRPAGGARRAPRPARLRAGDASSELRATSPGTIRFATLRRRRPRAHGRHRDRRAVHRAGELTSVRQRRADRAEGAAGRWDDRDRRGRSRNPRCRIMRQIRRSFAARCARAPGC